MLAKFVIPVAKRIAIEPTEFRLKTLGNFRAWPRDSNPTTLTPRACSENNWKISLLTENNISNSIILLLSSLSLTLDLDMMIHFTGKGSEMEILAANHYATCACFIYQCLTKQREYVWILVENSRYKLIIMYTCSTLWVAGSDIVAGNFNSKKIHTPKKKKKDNYSSRNDSI